MKNKVIILLFFTLMVGIQWFIPIRMISEKHIIWMEGREYKFQMTPLDPEDPFRGKYLQLRFEENHYRADDQSDWQSGDPVYVQLKRNAQGFVRIIGLARSVPTGDVDFVKATVRNTHGEDSLQMYIDYPFDRYYINEKISGALEERFRETVQDSAALNYALVRIRSGEAILKEVYLDDIPVTEWFEQSK